MDAIGKEIAVDEFAGFPLTEEEQLLCIGAVISREIRAAVFSELGYTCSTGIASNKLLSKLASPLNKPDGQTVSGRAIEDVKLKLILTRSEVVQVIAPRFVGQLLQSYPLRKVRGLGGKLGHQLEEIYHSLESPGQSSSGEIDQEDGASSAAVKPKVTANAFIVRCSLDDLAKHVGRDTASYVHRVCSGDDGDDPVNEKKVDLKAFSCVKQFDGRTGLALTRVEQLEYWARVIAEEMILRCEDERIENKRFPRQLAVRFGRPNEKPLSRPLSIAQDTTVDDLYAATMATLRQHLDSMFPLSFLVMSAKDFMPLDSRSVSSISSFFAKASEPRAKIVESQLKRLPAASLAAPAPISSKKRKISAFFDASPATSCENPTVDLPPHSHSPVAATEGEHHPLESTTSTCATPPPLDTAFYCEKCGTSVAEPPDEHADFHFALELSRAERSATSSALPASARRGPLDAFVTKS